MTDNLSYENAIKELQEIIEQIESASLPLDKAVSLFERGQQLIKVCYKQLDGAKGKLTEIKENLGNLEEV